MEFDNTKVREELNSLRGILRIKIDEVDTSLTLCKNRFAKKSAKIKSLHLEGIPEEEGHIIYPYDEITLVFIYHITKNDEKIKDISCDIKYVNNGGFSKKKLLECVQDFEEATRPMTVWFGGVDVHHKFLEGLKKQDGENRYWLSWGS
jgi:hypothetical protein